MSRAFLFPGQGTDIAPAVADWSAHSPAVARHLERVAALLGGDLESLLARGGAALQPTAIAQPVLTALTLAIDSELRNDGIEPDCVAGHSLGEVAAFAACGSVDRQTAIELAVARGRSMARAAADHPGGMLVLLDSDPETVEAALAHGSAAGVVELAAHNAPDEWVLTGQVGALEAIGRRFAVRRLPVDGAWHSQLMTGARAGFVQALGACHPAPPRVPFFCNATARPVEDPGAFADLLGGQLTRPIRWVECIRNMHAAGVEEFVVCGPGKSLRAMVRKILGAGVRIRLVASMADLETSGSRR